MKNILFIAPYAFPAWGYGGPPRINHDLAIHLTKAGNKVEFYTTDALSEKRNFKATETIQNITIKRFKNINNWLAWNYKIFVPIGFARALKANIKRFDFVFLSDFRNYQNIIAFRFCQKYKIPYCLAAYGSIPIPHGLKKYIKQVIDAIWTKRMVAGASFLLGQTEHEKKLYCKYQADQSRCKIFPLGINLKYFKQSKINTRLFRKKYDIKSYKNIILYIGRINRLKGIDFLIKSMPEIIKLIPDAQLLIIGRDDGYYLKTLQNMIVNLKLKMYVKIIGPLYETDNYPAYKIAKIFVFMPRHYEETSLACLASLALGTPVITNHQSSIPFLNKYKAGYEISHDKDIYIKKLISILKNHKLNNEMGNNGKKLIKNVFDISRVGKLLEQYIKEVLHE
ncbi:MAG: Glycosyltransferase [Candidatus Berkelbacteria bacterium Licking1014_7]|uniref:Glycosyltransferase n=1 Tax=Candidatus Berkelbacteria bacterium Licking1014_7 TaxID=2017147 RepID=A0A554LJ54_9BACT|nr:MAG: Glycosyltransferase [Candidatus Berkelbacteria bacterium Licking1014_7]